MGWIHGRHVMDIGSTLAGNGMDNVQIILRDNHTLMTQSVRNIMPSMIWMN